MSVGTEPASATYHADLHTHAIGDSRYDGRVSDLVARHLEGALMAGLQVIGVTDHDDLRPGLMAAEYAAVHALPLLVVPGMEVTTNDGHLVVLGLATSLQPWRSMTDTIASAREQQAICLLPHPFFPALRERTDVDAMERLNFRYGDFDVFRDDIAVVASSDAHSPADLIENPRHTLLTMTEFSWSGLVDALGRRQASIIDVVRHADATAPVR